MNKQNTGSGFRVTNFFFRWKTRKNYPDLEKDNLEASVKPG